MKPEICPANDAGLLLRQTQEQGASGIASAGKFYERSGVPIFGHFNGEQRPYYFSLVHLLFRR